MRITQRIDIKAIKLNALGDLLNDPNAGLTANKLIFVTDSSLIYGTYVKQQNLFKDKVANQLMPYGLLIEASKSAYEQAQKEGVPTINNSVSIVLTDVTIMPFSAPNVKINLNTLSIFTDKILGFTYGNLSTGK